MKSNKIHEITLKRKADYSILDSFTLGMEEIMKDLDVDLKSQLVDDGEDKIEAEEDDFFD